MVVADRQRRWSEKIRLRLYFSTSVPRYSLFDVNQGISRGGELNCLYLSLWTLEGLLVLVHRASIIRSASKLGTRSLGKGSRWR